jgi:hypothetical protein
VTLTATPDGSSAFGSWTNCDEPSNNTCTQTVDADETVTASFDADDESPTATMLKPSKTLQFAKSIPLAWSGSDTGGSGLMNFTIKMKKAPAAGTFGSFSPIASLTATTKTSAMFRAAAGFTYCFRARARDHAGNTSSPGASKCTELPFDDRPMSASGTWTRKNVAAAYFGTMSNSTQHGAALRLANVHARRIGIVYRTCTGCGRIAVWFGPTPLGSINLAPTSACPITVGCFSLFKAFSSVKTGTVKFVVSTSGKKVQVDGLIANLKPWPTFGIAPPGMTPLTPAAEADTST